MTRFKAQCVVAVLVVLAFALCLGTSAGGDGVEQVISNLGLASVALLAAASCFVRARHHRARARWSWRLIAAGSLSWGLGQLVWTWYESVLHVEVPLPSLSDVGYLGMPIFTAAGLLMIPLAAQSTANRARSVLDGAMVATSLLLISFMVVLHQLVQVGADSKLALVISLGYPLGDVIVVTIVLFTLARDRHRHAAQMPLLLVGAGLVTFSVSDSGFAYLTMIGAYTSGSVIDVGWFAGFVLILLAGRKPEREVQKAADEPIAERPLGVMLPYIVVIGAVLVSLVYAFRITHVSLFVYWNRSLLIVLMIGRQMLTMLENRALTRNLENRVETRTSELRASEQRFRALVQHSSDVVTVIDLESEVLYQSESITRVFGHDPETVTGRPLTELVSATDGPQLLDAIRRVARTPFGTTTHELTIVHADGRDCQVEMTITNLLDDANVGALVCNTRDVTERKTLETQLTHEAFHDALTGLANRALFTDRVEQELRRCGDDAASVAMLFLDLDGFKEINDSLGHAAGDHVLTAVAQRLRASVRVEDTVARFGGDEFAILVATSPDGDTDTAEDVALRVLQAMEEPFVVDHSVLHVTASIGIAFGGPEAEDAGQIMRNADLAMYRTKAGGVDGYTLYQPDMHSELVERLELAADMRRGLAANEFSIHFQPNVDLTSGQIVGFEALARWQHPDRGFVPPVEFIPIAETTGLIHQVGTWILEEACRQAQEWTVQQQRPIAVSVNVSARQLDQPDFIDIVQRALADSGLRPDQLCLEMTESVLLNDTEAVLNTLNALKAVGIRLAIDDFGTGYSSLSYLNKFPFDILKIDKSFIDRLNSQADESTLARTIVQLGKGLGVRTVAEGLEHFEQFMVLRRMGCDIGQGYYFSKPVPVSDATELLADQEITPWTPELHATPQAELTA